jgi:hypothetical protein
MLNFAFILFIASIGLKMSDLPASFEIAYVADILLIMSFFYFGYQKTSRVNIKTRIVCLVFAFFCLSYIVNVVMFVLGFSAFSGVAFLVSLFIYISLTVRTALLQYKESSDKYYDKGSFVIYKKPVNFTGYLMAIFYRYGSAKIVIDGREFGYKRVYKEKAHAYNSGLLYKRVADIDIERARLMVGNKWKWYNNCFDTVRGLRNGNGDNPRICGLCRRWLCSMRNRLDRE